MADESFSFEIKADPSSAASAIDKTEQGLEKVEEQAKKTGAAIDGAFQDKNGRWRDANNKFLAMGKNAGTASTKIKGTGTALTEAAGGANKASAAIGETSSVVSDLVAVAAAYIGLSFGEHIVDDYTIIGNKLRVVAKDQDNLNGMMNATFAIAQDTRTSWEAITSTYQRLANATRGLGASQKQVLDLTTELAEGMRISGSNTQEAGAAMAELTHAFMTGTLQSREFRVMMKDANPLMIELQKVSGKAGNEFAEMGKKGKITASLLMDWFSKAGPAIHEKFGLVIPTIAEDLTIVHNAATKFFGEAADGAGVMQGLASAARWVAANFDTIGKVVLAAVEAIGGLYIIEKVIGLVKLLTTAIMANPLGALLVAVTTGIMLLRQFGDQINVDIPIIGAAGDAFATVGDVLRATWEVIKEVGAAIGEFLSGAWTALKQAFSDGLDASGMKASLGDALRFIATFVATGIEMFKHFKEVAIVLFVDIPIELANAFIAQYPIIKEILEKIVNGVIHAVNGLKDLANAPQVYMLEKQMDNVREKQHDALTENLKDRSPAGNQKSQATQMAYNAMLDKMQEQVDQLKGKAIGFDLEVDTKKLSDMARDARDHRVNVTKDLQKDIEDDVQHWEALIQKFANMRISAKKGAGTIGTTPGNKEADLPDEKALKALEKLRAKYAEIAGASSPYTEALYKIAEAQKTVDAATRLVDKDGVHLIAGYGDGEAVMARYAEKYRDVLDPMGTFLDKQGEEYDALGKSKEQRALDAAAMEEILRIRKDGLIVGDAEIAQITKTVAMVQKRRDEAQMIETIQAPWKEYNKTIEVGTRLLNAGLISQYDYTEAVKKAREAYIATTPEAKSFTTGLTQGLQAVRDTALDVASTVKTQLVDAFNDVESAVTDLVVKGTVDWKGMVQGMLGDTTKVIMRMGEAKLAEAIAPTASTAVAGAGTSAAITSSFATGGITASTELTAGMSTGGATAAVEMTSGIVSGGTTAAAAMAAAITGAGGTAAAAMAAAMAAGGAASGAEQGIAGAATAAFATGGSFRVGGSGGTDSQMVAFRATPGEQVSIQPQQASAGNNRSNKSGNGDGGNTKVINSFDPKMAIAAIDSPEGERIIMNVVERNRTFIKGHTTKS